MTSFLLGVRNQTIWAPFKNNLQIGARSITMNKASGGDGIPVELLQILPNPIKANRLGKSGNSDRLYFLEFRTQNHSRW